MLFCVFYSDLVPAEVGALPGDARRVGGKGQVLLSGEKKYVGRSKSCRSLPRRPQEMRGGLFVSEHPAVAGTPGADLLFVGGALGESHEVGGQGTSWTDRLLGLCRVGQGDAVVSAEVATVALLGEATAVESAGLKYFKNYSRRVERRWEIWLY